MDGIRPVPGENEIYLEWHPNPENDLSGYEIYLADSVGINFRKIADITIHNGFIDTFFIISSPPIDTTCWYYLRAEDKSGNLSVPSDTLHFMILEKPILTSFGTTGTTNETQPTFRWYINPPESQASAFIVELVDQDLNFVTQSPLIQRTNYAPQGRDDWKCDVILEPSSSFYYRIISAGLLDELHIPHAGSISAWKAFRTTN